jgi:hypothetical protein
VRSDGLDAERMGRALDLVQFPHGRWIVAIRQDRQSAKAGDDLAQEFEALARKSGRRERQAGDVAARPRQTGDEATAKRVRHCREHDRDDRGRLFRCERRRSRRHNDIDLEPDKLGGDVRETLGASLRPTNLNRDGASLDPAKFAQSLHKSGYQLGMGGRCTRDKEPDSRQLPRLLRTRHEWPRRRAAEERDELASLQLIEVHPIPHEPGPRKQDTELAGVSQEVTERFHNLLAVGEGGRCLKWVQTENSRQGYGTAGLPSTADICCDCRHGR